MPKPIFVEDSDAKIAEIIRVNYAGEYGACRIYKGQIDFVKNNQICKTQIISMLQHEEKHCVFFKQQIQNRQVRPTFLMPLWNILGYVSGAITASIGSKYAMFILKLWKVPLIDIITSRLCN
ncbi:ubiquinone biosynthesis COQ7 family protein [Orientia chuto str. Dubai]|uniref:Ubiquinone biosynthesis COQ7 family protein n=1 Tax=Orientia chuto str. Dubai TaxID=1359168 RepID=A0A0F3MN32_9RICK|nr:demethoxyubiquinone hydroxylase family protein [Candidatus Orientia mediorientalis]KJV57173.1 ubiquinone biosynthesis COQ7 family protein [Orientia chuto str. Dubai]